MRPMIPKQFEEEDRRIALIWIDGDDDMEKVVRENASPEYQRYWFAERERHAELRSNGIIED